MLVDDEPESRKSVAEFLSEMGHAVLEAAHGEQALALMQKNRVEMVLTDIRMPGMSGTALLKEIKSRTEFQDIHVVLYSGFADLDTAVEALRAGAYDYIFKPIKIEELVSVVERVAEYHALKTENSILTSQFDEAVEAAAAETRSELADFKQTYFSQLGPGTMIIQSPVMKTITEEAKQLHTNRNVPVLIEGETGTGKEMVAKLIHYGSSATTRPFVALNCAALSPSLFEAELFGYEAGAFTGGLPRGQKGKFDLAAGGTLFLDEISEIPVALQAKLLRVLQEKEFYRVGGLKKQNTDVRVICATNTDLSRLVASGSFRADLYYRLSVAKLALPPLRERPDEIIPLATLFLRQLALDSKKQFQSIDDSAARILKKHHWPGNIRELRNVIEWAVLMFDETYLKPHHLRFHTSPELRSSVTFPPGTEQTAVLDPFNFILPGEGLVLDEFIQRVVDQALQLHRGNKSETARYLGISRRSLYSRLKIESRPE